MANAERKKQGKKLLAVERLGGRPVAEQRVEIVERKGLGHPDTICDAVHEQISVDLCGEYENRFGRVLHHNIDKGLLVAGSSEPKTGGGRMISPMRLVIGDRATAEFQGEKIDVASVVESSVAGWVRRNLRFVEPGRDLVLQNELKPGSAQLSDIFARATIGANDTSAAVGYAPHDRNGKNGPCCRTFLERPGVQKTISRGGRRRQSHGVPPRPQPVVDRGPGFRGPVRPGRQNLLRAQGTNPAGAGKATGRRNGGPGQNRGVRQHPGRSRPGGRGHVSDSPGDFCRRRGLRAGRAGKPSQRPDRPEPTVGKRSRSRQKPGEPCGKNLQPFDPSHGRGNPPAGGGGPGGLRLAVQPDRPPPWINP